MSKPHRSDGPSMGGSAIMHTRSRDLMQRETDLQALRRRPFKAPPLEDYQAWIDAGPPTRRSRHATTAAQYRRLAILVKQEGLSPTTAGQRVGMGTAGIQLMKRLPPHLKGE